MSSTDHKADFPIFSATPHVYLDSAATSHKPQVVIDAITDFYRLQYGTVRRGLYRLSSQATSLFEQARSEVASFIGAAKPTEIIFTSGATESINLVAQSYLRPLLQSGDEIIISILEHHANFIPWQQLAIEKNARLIVLPLDDQLDIDQQQFQNVLCKKTKMVAITQISNVTGGINPAQQMIKMARQVGAKVLIDGAQSIGHHTVDVKEMDCDFLCFLPIKCLVRPAPVFCMAKKKF
ncbi:MAG: aminotransferase class V-fold PLP-dependent enzyme [Saprospiraceae bacterium]|nr:aminotransferase class V-fold PLP-dependent enzyme [Saprospiraceae bacterium]